MKASIAAIEDPPVTRTVTASSSVVYPYCDGAAMSDNIPQLNAILDAINDLRTHFRGERDTHVAGNQHVYYQRRDLEKSVVPDVYVVRGVAALPLRSIRVWEFGKAPDFVLEVASGSTQEDDRVRKPPLYAGMGVREYWRFFPPDNEVGEGRDGIGLEGNRLAGREYVPIQPLRGRWVCSAVLCLDLRAEGPAVRFRDSETLIPLLHHEEQVQARIYAEEQCLKEAAARRREAKLRLEAESARRSAEARIAELEARIEASVGSPARPGER